jgi:hypothetical protein
VTVNELLAKLEKLPDDLKDEPVFTHIWDINNGFERIYLDDVIIDSFGPCLEFN